MRISGGQMSMSKYGKKKTPQWILVRKPAGEIKGPVKSLLKIWDINVSIFKMRELHSMKNFGYDQ